MEERQKPGEYLRVFISSAQSEENGFAWLDVRRRIKEHLDTCPYLLPFIIEDRASGFPSTQLFQHQVQRADVVILLVKGEVRKGTSIEYALARQLRKPLLVYFLEDPDPSPDVLNLKRELESSDYCTYHPMKSFDGVENHIYNEIIEDVIRYYQGRAFPSLPAGAFGESVPIPDEPQPSRASVPTRTTIAMFQSAYPRLYELLEIGRGGKGDPSADSDLHAIGTALIDWLVTGAPLDCGDGLQRLIESAAGLYGSTEWLRKRWDAIRFGMAGDADTALDCERQAHQLAKDAGMPVWIVNDILIDCRNFEVAVAESHRGFYIDGAAQKELKALDTIVYLPVADRYLDDLYHDIAKEEFRTGTAAPNTSLLGSSLPSAVESAANYLFSIALYGSYTHLHIARAVLARTLSKYAELTGDQRLLSKSLDLYILQGNPKDYKLFINHYWDSVYAYVAAHADALWDLARKAPVSDRDGILQAVLETVGLYFSDPVFARAETYLTEREAEVYWGTSEAYFDCILANIARLDQSMVVAAVANIMADGRFHLGRKLSRIISCIHLEGVSPELRLRLRDVLIERLPSIVEQNGSPQFIASLVNQDREVFGPLETLPGNGLTGIEEKFYRINTGSDRWIPILEESLDTAGVQFEANSKPGMYTAFAIDPYVTISDIVRRTDGGGDAARLTALLTERFLPHAVKVLGSEAAIPVKTDCAACLCDVLSYLVRHESPLPESVLAALRTVEIHDGISFLSIKNRETYALRVFMARTISGVSDRAELLQWCIGYEKRPANERIVLADCVEKYLYLRGKETTEVDSVLLSLVFQSFEDELYNVRRIACRCLSYLLHSPVGRMAEDRLYRAALDPSHYVRNSLISLCEEGAIAGEPAERILDTLSKDANYAIRGYALRVKEAL